MMDTVEFTVRQSPTLENIIRHWIGEFKPDALEPKVFPFHLENFCRENDAWLNLLVVETGKRFFVKRAMHPVVGAGWACYELKEHFNKPEQGQKPVAWFTDEQDLTRFLHGAKG